MINGIHHISMKCRPGEEFERARDFYLHVLGFSAVREWPEGIMIDSGCGLLEIFSNGPGIKAKGAIRHIAFSTDDVDGIAAKVRAAGYEVFIEPNDIVIRSEPAFHARMAFCCGPLGEEIEFFQEQASEKPIRLERMDDFFAARINGYDEHMKKDIAGSSEFYAYTASLLPATANAQVLDLGCGTGLELEEYFSINPSAHVTGIDLSEAMLNVLQSKFPEKNLTLIWASYFDVPLGEGKYDAAVSVESLHHFSAEKKALLYRKLHDALKEDGRFVLTDYFAESEELEAEYFRNLAQLKKEQGISDDAFYHYDTPLLAEHEMDILRHAGFSDVRMMKKWGISTYTVLAEA